MTVITPPLLKSIRADVEEALAAVAKKHGVTITTGRGTYTAEWATMKLEIAAIDSDGTVQTKEAVDFVAYAFRYGLSPDDLGKEFSYGGETFEIIGLKTRATKMPILGQSRENGKIYKFPANAVKACLAAAA